MIWPTISLKLNVITSPSMAGVPNIFTVMNNTPCKGTWDEECTDILYATLECKTRIYNNPSYNGY